MASSDTSQNSLLALSSDLASRVEKVSQSVVAVHARRFSSSGIHWQDGIIVTSDETIKREEEIPVTLPSGKTVLATLVGRDPSTDVAVLKLASQLPIAEIGSSEALRVGNLVLALGRSREGLTANLGMVSVLGDSWRSMRGGTIDQLIRLDVMLPPESVGGPLVEATGGVVGFNTFGPRRSVLTIPATTVNRVVEQLLSQGRITKGYLGLGMQPVALPSRFKTQFSFEQGAIAINIEPEGAADQGGILLGDVLVAVNDVPISAVADVQAFLGSDSIGETLKVRLIRGGELINKELVVGERTRT